MILLGFISSLPLQIMLLTLCASTSSAPTHHLTIGVQGNTPTLFVTSAEIGIPSETERSHLKQQQKIQKEYKSNEKSKYQKTKTSMNSKKLKPIYFTKSTVTLTPPLPADVVKSNQTLGNTIGGLTVIQTHTDIPKIIQDPGTTLKMEPTILDISTSTTTSTFPSTIAIENSTPTTEIIVKANKADRSGEATTEKETRLLETMPAIDDDGLMAKTAIENIIEATAITSTTTASTTTTVTTTSVLPLINSVSIQTYEIVENDKIINVTAKQMDNRQTEMDTAFTLTTAAGPSLWSTSDDTTQQSITTTEEPKINDDMTDAQIENILGGNTTLPSEIPQVTKMAIALTPSSTLPSEIPPVTKTPIVLTPASVATTTEFVLKLIDLEKHNTQHVANFDQQDMSHDNGHDGLKKIKKKQLTDKHFLEVTFGETPKETDATTSKPPKHGFLGPILMEEKTFHVIHSKTVESNKTTHLPTAVESLLRHNNFVEIKPTTEDMQQIPATAGNSMSKITQGQIIGITDSAAQPEVDREDSPVLSSTTFEVAETVASNSPPKVLHTEDSEKKPELINDAAKKSESKISDIQIEVYDSTIDSIVASTNFKDNPQGKTTKPPGSFVQQERFTQYVIDRTETSTQESINFSTIQVASGLPEPAAIEIHINVSESFNNDGEDLDVSFPQTDYTNTGRADEVYDEVKEKDDIKLKVPTSTGNSGNKDRSDEILVVEIVDNEDNATDRRQTITKIPSETLAAELRDRYSTPPPPPPPPPYQGNFDRDSDTIFYISNTEVKVGESPPSPSQKALDERKLKLENQFFPVNYMASTHPNMNNIDDHHLYEEDIILSSDRNQADSLKIYRNRNEPSPPLDVTYVGESIIEVEQSPDTGITTTIVPEHMITPQPDVIIQPAILPEISIGVPVIGELPPQIELKEIDFMPNDNQLPHSSVYGNEETQINVDNRLDDSSIQYGGDLIDESADGGFDGVEGSYPFGNPATMEQRKQNHGADYAHLYINYGVNNMRKDELTADIKDSGEINVIVGNNGVNIMEQNSTGKEFMSPVALNNITSLNESERMSNVTAFSIMEDPNELDEKNTEDIINLISLAIGLFIVILPVVVTCSMLWALRYLYKKYHSTSTDSNGNLDPSDAKALGGDDAAEKGECKQVPCFPSHSDKDDIQKCPDTFHEPSTDINSVKFSTERSTQHVDSSIALHCKLYSISSKTRDCPILLPLNQGPVEKHTVRDDIQPNGPNGSITKMTLENNLLIVETEERNDISRVARETKMDYNKDGVFVVEVSRGIDSRTIPESPVTEGSEKLLSMFETKHNGNMGYKMTNEKVSHNNEKVQIHSPPPEKTEEGPRSLHQIEEVDESVHSPRQCDTEDDGVRLNLKSNTGLSQSDLSSTSSNDSNKDYCYGNQELYVVEQTGYCTSSPTANVILKCDTKDIKDDDRNSENGPYLEHSPHKEEETKTKEDVIDTINNRSGVEKFEEKQTMQGEKEREKEETQESKTSEEAINIKASILEADEIVEKPIVQDEKEREEEDKAATIGQIDKENNENKAICNGHVELNGIEEENLEHVEQNGIEEEYKATESVSHGKEIQEGNNISANSINKAEEIHLNSNEEQETITIVNNTNSPDIQTGESKKISENSDVIEASLSTHDDRTTPSLKDVSPSKILDVVVEESSNHIEESNVIESNGNDYLHVNGSQESEKITVNGRSHQNSLDVVLEEPLNQMEDIPESNGNGHLHLNGSQEESDIKSVEIQNKNTNADSDKLHEQTKDSSHLTNGSHILPDVVPSGKLAHLTNGDVNGEVTSVSNSEFENGYDSIMSLPDPPNSDEMFCGDLSEQQMDSLPPPPPPMLSELNGETFNLKDLPPPLTNCETECLPTEESTNYYASLPPPPPTTLDVTVTAPTTNGNMHASPLTPPASPPPHFSNGLHTAMCPPIAVDVNGS